MADQDDDAREIRRVHRQWWEANVGLDVEKMSECFAPDYLMWNLNGHPYYCGPNDDKAHARRIQLWATTHCRHLTAAARPPIASPALNSVRLCSKDRVSLGAITVFSPVLITRIPQAGSA